MYPPPPPPPPPARMSTSTKVVVALAVAIVGACAACVGAGVAGGFWLKSQAPAMMEDVRDAVREGRTFAQGRAQRECVAEGVRRSGVCGSVDLRCAIRASGFLNACVRVAAATPGFCDGVPPSRDVMLSAQWRDAACAAQGRARDQRCANVLAVVQGYCEHPGPLPPEIADAGR
jgi:hypothetical protein